MRAIEAANQSFGYRGARLTLRLPSSSINRHISFLVSVFLYHTLNRGCCQALRQGIVPPGSTTQTESMVLHMIRKAATWLATQAILVQLPPILVRIVNRDLATGRYPTRNDENALFSSPEEFLELAVWTTRMIDEAREIAHVALVNLVDIIRGPADHDVQAFNAASNQAHKFGNGRPSIEVLPLSVNKRWRVGSAATGKQKTYTAGNHAVILAIRSVEQLHCDGILWSAE